MEDLEPRLRFIKLHSIKKKDKSGVVQTKPNGQKNVCQAQWWRGDDFDLNLNEPKEWTQTQQQISIRMAKKGKNQGFRIAWSNPGPQTDWDAVWDLKRALHMEVHKNLNKLSNASKENESSSTSMREADKVKTGIKDF